MGVCEKGASYELGNQLYCPCEVLEKGERTTRDFLLWTWVAGRAEKRPSNFLYHLPKKMALRRKLKSNEIHIKCGLDRKVFCLWEWPPISQEGFLGTQGGHCRPVMAVHAQQPSPSWPDRWPEGSLMSTVASRSTKFLNSKIRSVSRLACAHASAGAPLFTIIFFFLRKMPWSFVHFCSLFSLNQLANQNCIYMCTFWVRISLLKYIIPIIISDRRDE